MSKIVFLFESTYPYYTGGIETWIYNVCERLVNKHDIDIITIDYYGNSLTGKYDNIDDRIKFHPVKNLCHIKVLKPFIRSYISVINSYVTADNMYKKFCEIYGKEDKIILISLGSLFAAKVAKKIKRKYNNIFSVVSVRSLHPEIYSEHYPLLRKTMFNLEKKNLCAANVIWANGEDTFDNLKKKGFNSIIIKNGVDVLKMKKIPAYDYKKINLEGKKIIVTIGTLLKEKGYYELIQALSILKKIYNMELHMVAIGKGNPAKFKKFAGKNGVSEQVHFLGEHRDGISYAKSANVVACLSGGSGYSMAALEAMLSYTPIIAWDSPVYRQLIKDHESGILVEPWNSYELAKGIYDLFSNEINYREMGIKACDKAMEFDWNYVVEDIEEKLLSYSL